MNHEFRFILSVFLKVSFIHKIWDFTYIALIINNLIKNGDDYSISRDFNRWPAEFLKLS